MWRSLKKHFALFLFFSVVVLEVASFPAYSEISLTYEKAQMMLKEITESKKDLQSAEVRLEEQEKNLQSAEVRLEEQEKDFQEQKESYEMQLNKVTKENRRYKTAVTITGTSTVILTVIVLIILL